MTYSPKQLELLKAWQHGELRRINLLEGSVRSGKTWISLVQWAFWVATMPVDKNYLMVGKTLTSLKRNCLDLLQSLVGADNFRFSTARKEARLFRRKVYLEGVNDSRAEGKIRGMTLQGAYCDELTLFSEDFFAMLLSRLSEAGAKLIATTNPDSPNHWVKTQYIDRQDDLDILVIKYLIDDNPFLDAEYVKQLYREYTGVFRERYIYGRWVIAEGLVYPMFSPAQHVVHDIPPGDGTYYISVDYGTINPFSAGLWKVQGGVATRIAEYYYDSKAHRKQKTDEEYYAELDRLADGHIIQYIVIDPSAASMITTIRRHGKYSVRKANNSVVDGIRTTASLLQSGKIKIHRNCIGLIKELGLYSWDDTSAVDRPIKANDHACDDMRYFCMSVLARGG